MVRVLSAIYLALSMLAQHKLYAALLVNKYLYY